MNTVLLLIIGIPIIEIYLFIKIGSQIGALNTICLIFLTAIIGVSYAKHEGFNTLKSERHINVFNITSKFMSMDKDEIVKLFFKKDSHYSAYGHHKIAKYVSDYILKEKII